MLRPQEKREHLIELWRLCFLKSLGASQIKRVFTKLHERVINFGSTKNVNTHSADLEAKRILEQKWKIILLPDDPIKRFWNILIICLLVYVATYVPYSISFHKPHPPNLPWTFQMYFDLVVDILFIMDLLISFISAYED